MFELFLILLSAVVFPLLHMANAWAFSSLEITPHVGLIYLPAFIRLLNVLVLGKVRGTLATALGGIFLMQLSSDHSLVGVVNVLCSALAPVLAVMVFRFYSGRDVSLLSLKDLGIVTLGYCIANAVFHHLAWSLLDPYQVVKPHQLLWMMLGDFNGALIGAYALKWVAKRFNKGGPAQRG
ncbi:MAG: hypothetical protein Q7U05_00750 [Polaromonas sp.]|nr:hypothetical protein [Polaromonas sp.]